MQVGVSGGRLDLRPAVHAIGARFVVFGLVAGSWMARAPELKSALGMTYGTWGQVGLAAPCGSLIAFGASAVAMRRWGSRRVSAGAAMALLAMLPLMALSRSATAIAVCLLGYGLAVTMLNVPTNNLAIEVERRVGRSLMNRFHAAYSVGLAAGAGISSGVAALGASPTTQFLVTNALAAVWLASTREGLAIDTGAREPARARGGPGPGLVALLAPLAAACEMSIAMWCPIYVHEGLRAGATGTTLAFSCFAVAMLAGRVAGDRAVQRLGRRSLLVLSGALVAVGMCLTLLATGLLLACCGLALAGVGVAATLPTVVSEAGARARSESSMVTLWLCAWPGTALAAPLVGWLSAQSSLRAALLVPALSGVLLALGSAHLLQRESRTTPVT